MEEHRKRLSAGWGERKKRKEKRRKRPEVSGCYDAGLGTGTRDPNRVFTPALPRPGTRTRMIDATPYTPPPHTLRKPPSAGEGRPEDPARSRPQRPKCRCTRRLSTIRGQKLAIHLATSAVPLTSWNSEVTSWTLEVTSWTLEVTSSTTEVTSSKPEVTSWTTEVTSSVAEVTSWALEVTSCTEEDASCTAERATPHPERVFATVEPCPVHPARVMRPTRRLPPPRPRRRGAPAQYRPQRR